MQESLDTAKQLELALVGFERSFYIIRDQHGSIPNEQVMAIEPIQSVVLKEFPFETGAEAGDYSFPFTMLIPYWLPENTFTTAKEPYSENGKDDQECCLSYMLRAQFVPNNEKDWVDARYKIAKFRGERFIWVQRPLPEFWLEPNLRQVLLQKVGGFMGIASDQVVTRIYFDKNIYQPGETIKVAIECDNSKCSKPITSFKLKLKRKFFIFENDGMFNSKLNSSKYIIDKRVEGCRPKESCVRVIEIQIPAKDLEEKGSLTQFTEKVKTDKLQEIIFSEFTPTMTSATIGISYSLKVFVKHDAWNQFGSGAVKTLPIYIGGCRKDPVFVP